ncbi:MAG: hypothetical protein WCJ35_14950 [Planctomycetota bacterium]
MNHPFRFGLGMVLLALACLTVDRASAQPAIRPAAAKPPAVVPVPAARPAAAAPATPGAGGAWITPGSPFRKLAPGVMQDVIPDRSADETVEHHDVTELLYVNDAFDFAKDVPFRHEVWMLEIKYKPVRMIWADIPGSNARMQQKQIWYMVYQVTNPGKVFRSVEQDDKLYKLVTEDKPVRFTPVFTLEVHNALRKELEGSTRAYVEQYIPIVLPAIRAREDKNREFLTSEQMAAKEIRVGETVWGIATWQDVVSNNVWFSVYVEGLTNAYKFSDDPAKYAAYKNKTGTAPFREIRTKVLKINFWRPGDEYRVKETQVRTGVPELPGGPPSKAPYEWVWWKTFPPADKAIPPGN